MIRLHHKNSLANRIGTKNGINKRLFLDFLKKNNPLVKKIFDQKDKDGYAFSALPDDTEIVKKIQNYMKMQKKWKNIVVIGIGGSALGAIAVKEALLGQWNQNPKLNILDNIDPDWCLSLLNRIILKETHFIVISKSGGTVEPAALFDIALQRLKKELPKEWKKHLTLITDSEKGLLREFGNKEKISMFDIPPKIGGRFSALTSVGLVPCGLAGIDIKGLLNGAKKMRDEIKKTGPEKNPALILASLQYLLNKKKKKPMTILMPYSNRLFRISDWYRQLLAESIGKNKKTGPTPINALGTTDQHSQLQLYNEGPEDKWIIFLRVLKTALDTKISKKVPKKLDFLAGKKLSGIIDAAYLGTQQALTKNKRPNLTIEIKKITPETIGALFMLFEFQVALLGLFYKVNAFDQPGVEESKRITRAILSSKMSSRTPKMSSRT